jgi:hypothetical protein
MFTMMDIMSLKTYLNAKDNDVVKSQLVEMMGSLPLK